ncbi:hypothetical protein ABMA70_00660 [Halobacteriovorax sp. XZX-3]|uniref:hypothetical protein n=1 Tax=unclassified Halobacteriovorax TaxID=2639665 RepID=UPI000CD1C02D|nr:hypothetical protein [Halobacteriovorax sp. DA5]POB14276.1 hypothetical protein C0Z22_04090 [Halobacteriovorax sp. DA5]
MRNKINKRKVGNIRLAIGPWEEDFTKLFSSAAKLMALIVHGQLIHFKSDEIFVFADKELKNFRVGVPMIGNLKDKYLESFDLHSGEVESTEFGIEKLKEFERIKNLYTDLCLSEEYFIRITSHGGQYLSFYEKYLIQ